MELITDIIKGIVTLAEGLPSYHKTILIISLIIIVCLTYAILRIVDPVKKANIELIRLLRILVYSQNKSLESMDQRFKSGQSAFNSSKLEERLKRLEKRIAKANVKKKKKHKRLFLISPFLMLDYLVGVVPLMIAIRYSQIVYRNRNSIKEVLSDIAYFKKSEMLVSESSMILLLQNRVCRLNVTKDLNQVTTIGLNQEGDEAIQELVRNEFNTLDKEINHLIMLADVLLIRGAFIFNLTITNDVYNSDDLFRLEVIEANADSIKIEIRAYSTTGEEVKVQELQIQNREAPFIYRVHSKITHQKQRSRLIVKYELALNNFVFGNFDFQIDPKKYYFVKIDKDMNLINGINDLQTNQSEYLVELHDNGSYLVALDQLETSVRITAHLNEGEPIKLEWEIV